MARIRGTVFTVGLLIAVTAVLLMTQACRKAASVPPKTDVSKQVVTGNEAKPPDKEQAKVDSPKPKPASTDTAATVAPKKPVPKPAPKTTTEPKVTAQPKAAALPKVDIDAHDAKFADGRPPKLEANGKPVTLLYYPPHMFSVVLTRNGQEAGSLMLGTITGGGGEGPSLAEIRIAARRNTSDPQLGKFQDVAVIYPGTTKKGQTWNVTAGGMDFKVEALDFGEWSDSMFPGSGMGWIELRISAK